MSTDKGALIIITPAPTFIFIPRFDGQKLIIET